MYTVKYEPTMDGAESNFEVNILLSMQAVAAQMHADSLARYCELYRYVSFTALCLQAAAASTNCLSPF
jgi:hypothetical protein